MLIEKSPMPGQHTIHRGIYMPFKSEAQRRKFAELVKGGKMSQATFDEWESATPKGKLPERIGPEKPKPTKMEQNALYRKKKYGF